MDKQCFKSWNYKINQSKIILIKVLAVIVYMILVSEKSNGQYNNFGTFTKINNLANLTDGYYLNTYFKQQDGSINAMNNLNGINNYFANTTISPINNNIIHPNGMLVWKITSNDDGGYTIFNESSQKYIYYNGTGNSVSEVTSISNASGRWQFSILNSSFIISNLLNSSRQLQYNTSSPRFACYAGTQQNITLYKLTNTQNTDFFRSKNSGLWTSLSSWESANNNINWIDATRIPDSNASFVYIQTGNTINLDSSLALPSINIYNDATLNILPGNVIQIPYSKTINIQTNGIFKLLADLNNSACIGYSEGQIIGNISVETYLPPLRKFRFLASSVSGANAAQWRNLGINLVGKGTHITGIGGALNNFDPSITNAPSAFWYNEVLAGSDVNVGSVATNDNGWTAFINGNTEALTNGKGFRILIRGDRTISLDGTGSVVPTATILTVNGTYPGHAININTTKTNSNLNSGYNLIGNPYPSSIDWNSISKGIDISNTYTIYNPSTNSYQSWNGLTGDASRFISAGQAFFVQQTGLVGGIQIDEGDKTQNKGGNYFKEKLNNHLKISLKVDSLNSDATFIHFNENSKDNFDLYDGLKFTNSLVNIASIGKEFERYAINSLSKIEGYREVALSILGTSFTSFDLIFEDVSSFEQHHVYLVDSYVNITVLLSDKYLYNVHTNKDSASFNNQRFKLLFIPKTTSIIPFKLAKEWEVFPNPVINQIKLLNGQLLAKNSIINYEIYNDLGVLLRADQIEFSFGEMEEINVAAFPKGIYFIKIQHEFHNQTIRFIK
jgi:hypothetical protein